MLELIALAVVFGIAFGLASNVKEKIKENQANRELRRNLKEQQANLEKLESDLHEKERIFADRDKVFHAGFAHGRKWLAEMIAEIDAGLDRAKEDYLMNKKHPAPVAAEVVSKIKDEKRELKTMLKSLEYQIKSYEEYFPFLEEYREIILDERIPLGAGEDNVEALETADPTLLFVTREEYEKLSITERNQLALDRYIARPKTNWEIGRFYERYLGYLREIEGWRVVYQGALRGYEDFGRDLICTRSGTVEIVQAKCWSRHKEIHEKHLFQLFGTTVHYKLENANFWVTPVFATTTALSKVSEMVADALRIRVDYFELPKEYPMIKCNINPVTHERIYHLPFDQQYDRVVIGAIPGECYVDTVMKAENKGFRRAWRWSGNREIGEQV